MPALRIPVQHTAWRLAKGGDRARARLEKLVADEGESGAVVADGDQALDLRAGGDEAAPLV